MGLGQAVKDKDYSIRVRTATIETGVVDAHMQTDKLSAPQTNTLKNGLGIIARIGGIRRRHLEAVRVL